MAVRFTEQARTAAVLPLAVAALGLISLLRMADQEGRAVTQPVASAVLVALHLSPLPVRAAYLSHDNFLWGFPP